MKLYLTFSGEKNKIPSLIFDLREYQQLFYNVDYFMF